MATDNNSNFLASINKEFLYYKNLGEKAMDQLEPEQLFVSLNEDSNSIATIIQHLSGNMISRWTDFLNSDGEKPWRERDSEFENKLNDAVLIKKKWDEGWDCLFHAINNLKPEELSQVVLIRNEKHTVLEAVNRQLAHYPYHVGQIIYAAKILKKGDWSSLSIPKN